MLDSSDTHPEDSAPSNGAPAPQTRFDRHPVLTLLGVVVTLLLVLDVASASLYTAVAGTPFHFRNLSQPAVERGYRNQKTVYHHDLAKKAVVAQAVWGDRRYFMATDSLGFKNAGPIDVPLRSAKPRMLFIGDSFTEGIGVTYSDTFVGRIGKALEPTNVEVLNAAVTSYSPIIYWRKIKYLLEEVGLTFDEVVVFLDISDIDDEANRYVLEDGDRVAWPGLDAFQAGGATSDHPVKYFIRSHTVALYWVLNTAHDIVAPEPKTAAQTRYAALASRFSINTPRGIWTVDPGMMERFGRRGLETSAHFLDELHRLLESRHLKMTLAVYPWPDQILNNDLDSVQVTTWSAWAASHGVPFLNYFPCFIERGAGEDARIRVLEQYFIPRDVHWNEAGHKLVADAFVSFYAAARSGTCALRNAALHF